MATVERDVETVTQVSEQASRTLPEPVYELSEDLFTVICKCCKKLRSSSAKSLLHNFMWLRRLHVVFFALLKFVRILQDFM